MERPAITAWVFGFAPPVAERPWARDPARRVSTASADEVASSGRGRKARSPPTMANPRPALTFLLVLACGLVAMSLVAACVRTNVLDTDRNAVTMAPIARSDGVYHPPRVISDHPEPREDPRVELHPGEQGVFEGHPSWRARIDRVRSVNTERSLRERSLRVGTVDFDTAGTDETELRLVGIAAREGS